MNNMSTDIQKIAKTQANSLLGHIDATLDNSSHYFADSDILNKVFEDPKVQAQIHSIKDYLEYYHGKSLANAHEFTMIFRLGLRVGACYEIEMHKKNQYDYME